MCVGAAVAKDKDGSLCQDEDPTLKDWLNALVGLWEGVDPPKLEKCKLSMSPIDKELLKAPAESYALK